MESIVAILGKGLWAGVAALGFGILFNIPRRTISIVFLLGLCGGLAKFSFLAYTGLGVVLATLLAALIVGIINVFCAHAIHTPPVVLVIPAVIPMVPGAFAYKAIIAFAKLAIGFASPEVISMAMENGVKTFFILLFIALGVSTPLLLLRKESVKHVRLYKRK